MGKVWWGWVGLCGVGLDGVRWVGQVVSGGWESCRLMDTLL